MMIDSNIMWVVSLCLTFVFVLSKLYISDRREGQEETNLPPKDPEDWTLTPSSTQWRRNDYCPKCKNTVGHHEFMSKICNSCGTSTSMGQRASRTLWNANNWVTQHKYPDGSSTAGLED